MKGSDFMKEYVNFDLSGKVAVVVGGTRGIGRALALGLAQCGADVAPVSRNEANSIKVAEEIRALGRRAVSFGVDATDYDRMTELRDLLLKEFGHIDILVNSQGIEIRGDILELSLENWRKLIGVNQESVFMSMKIFGGVMVKQRRGKVINIASISSFEGIGGSPAYTSSKGAILQLTKVGAIEWAPYNIQVNSLTPGWYSTELSPVFDGSSPDLANLIISKIPAGRPGKVEELAGACVYLASEASNYVTGATIVVDGGFLALGI